MPPNAPWPRLSEVGDGSYVLIERYNRTRDFAELKTPVRVGAADMADGLTAGEKAVYDLLPALRASNGWISDKPKGVAITDAGETCLITDKDGVDDWSGETRFLKPGDVDALFGDD